MLIAAMSTPAQLDSLFGNPWLVGPLSAVIWLLAIIPINAMLIGWTGSSPGKFMFGLKVLSKDHKPMGFGAALAREILVYLQGMGLGIPIVTLITHIAAYQRVTRRGDASWDESAKHLYLYRNHTVATRLLATLGVVLVIFGVIAIQAMQAINKL